MVSSITATVGHNATPYAALAPKILHVVAALVVAGALGVATGCGSSTGVSENPPSSPPPPPPPQLRDATTADLQNMEFSFSNGGAFDGALASQAATLNIGAFDASNTAPFRLESNQLSASGIATLNSPLTLNFRIVPAGLSFTGTPVSLEAGLDDNNVLTLDNAGTVSTASAAGIASAAPPVIFPAQLSGSQEVPAPVTTNAGGTAAVAPSPDGTSLSFQFEYTAIADVQQAHLHFGAPGENGAPIFFLCATDAQNPVPVPVGTTPQPCPAADTPMNGTLTVAELIPIVGVLETLEQAVAAIAAGNVYVNVHTAANPGGEIRGHVGPTVLQAGLSGTQEVPAVVTAATGSGSVGLNATQTQMSYAMTYDGLVDIQQAHIHVGIPGTNGGILLFLCATDKVAPAPAPEGSPDCPAVGATLNGTLTAVDFSATPGVDSFAAAVSRLLSGETYINVHTALNPNGELRGQVGPATVQAQLSGDNVVAPIVAAAGTGNAAVRLNASQTLVTYNMSYEIVGQQAANVHVGGPADNGDILFNLCDVVVGNLLQDCPNSQVGTPATISGTLAAADVLETVAPIAIPAMDFAAAANALLSNTTYANLTAGMGGDIRDQLEGPTVSFAAQIQPIFDNNCIACHGLAGGLTLELGVSHGNTVGVASGGRPALSYIAPREPDDSYLIRKVEGGPDIAGNQMPLNADPLLLADMELLRRWTAEGALDN